MEAFTKGNVSLDICDPRFQLGNDSYDNIADSLEEIVDLDNSKGVWTVYGQIKRGFINDVSLLGNDIKEPGDDKIIFQEILTHVVHPHP